MKRIGNLICIVIFCFIFSLHAQEDVEVTLQVKTQQGLPLQEAGVGKPFLLTVTVSGDGAVGKVFVDAHGSFELRNRGTTAQMHSINGVSTRQTIFQYVVRPKETGTFNLGPASVTLDGRMYSSNSVVVTVSQEPVERVTLHEPRLELIVPDGPIVIGQIVPLTVRFYHLGSSQLSSITPPKVEGFNVGTLEGPFKGTGDVEGVPYDFVEWRTEMVADQVGTFEFSPAHAVYSMQARDRTNMWQLLSDRFSFGMQQYETNSNSVEVRVDPLPPLNQTVNAVGIFTSLHAHVNQTTAKQGEGIIYTIEIGGDNAIKHLKHLELAVPDTLTAYESKTSMPTNRHRNPDEQRKIFEYVIQAREPGPVTIPAQRFTFYDPVQGRYKQLKTEPVQLTISADQTVQHNKVLEKTSVTQQEQAAQDTVTTQPQHLPLYAQGTAEYRTDTGMSSALFWSLLLLFLVGIALQWCRLFWQAYRVRNHNFLRARAAFHRASKRLVHARRERNAQELYNMFIDLFADRRGIAPSEVVESDMVAWLESEKIPTQTVKEWQAYNKELQTFAFYDAGQIPPADLFTQAEKWLALLEKTL